MLPQKGHPDSNRDCSHKVPMKIGTFLFDVSLRKSFSNTAFLNLVSSIDVMLNKVQPFVFFLCLTGLIFFTMFSAGQSISFSQPINDDGFDNVKIIGQDDDGFCLLQCNLPLELERDRVGFKSRKYKISYYGNDMILRWTKPVEAVTEGASVEAIAYFQNKIMAVTGIENKSQNMLTVFIQQMNNKGDIVSNNQIAKISFENSSDYGKAKIITSSNQKLAGIIVHEFINNNTQAAHFIAVDTVLKTICNKKLLINIVKKFLQQLDIRYLIKPILI